MGRGSPDQGPGQACPSWTGETKLSQNPGRAASRATVSTLTLSLSQRERGLFSVPGRLPLPLGEGWGEGSSH